MARLLSTVLAACAALLLAEAAVAHLKVTPGLLESGRETTLRIELPELLPGARPTGLDVSGPGVRMLESSGEGRLTEESRWRIRIAVATAPGPLVLRLRARYADGRAVTVRQAMTVLPAKVAPESPSSGRGSAAVVGIFLALLGAFSLVLVARRRGLG